MLWTTFWVVPRIERRLEVAVASALEDRGLHVSSIDARGTTVTLVGGPTSPEARLALAATVRSVPGVSEVRSLLLAEDDLPPGGGEGASGTARLAEAEPGPGATNPGRPDESPPFRMEPASDAVEGTPREADRPGAAERGDAGTPTNAPEAAIDADVSPGDPAAVSTDAPAAVTAPPPGEARDSSGPAATARSEEGASSEERPAPCRVRLMRLAEGRTLSFSEGSSILSEEDQAVLSELALGLRSCGEWTLTIVGFASASEGPDAWILADRRAYGAARFLLDRGIDESRIATVTGNTPSDEEGVPRVELFISGGE